MIGTALAITGGVLLLLGMQFGILLLMEWAADYVLKKRQEVD